MFIPAYGALEIIPVKTKKIPKGSSLTFALKTELNVANNPGFPSDGSKHLSQVSAYQDPPVESMKVRLAPGTCVEIEGEGIYSLPRGEAQSACVKPPLMPQHHPIA